MLTAPPLARDYDIFFFYTVTALACARKLELDLLSQRCEGGGGAPNLRFSPVFQRWLQTEHDMMMRCKII